MAAVFRIDIKEVIITGIKTESIGIFWSEESMDHKQNITEGKKFTSTLGANNRLLRPSLWFFMCCH